MELVSAFDNLQIGQTNSSKSSTSNPANVPSLTRAKSMDDTFVSSESSEVSHLNEVEKIKSPNDQQICDSIASNYETYSNRREFSSFLLKFETSFVTIIRMNNYRRSTRKILQCRVEKYSLDQRIETGGGDLLRDGNGGNGARQRELSRGTNRSWQRSKMWKKKR